MTTLRLGYFLDEVWLEIMEVDNDNINLSLNHTPTLIPVEEKNQQKYYLVEEAFEFRVVYLEPVDLDKE